MLVFAIILNIGGAPLPQLLHQFLRPDMRIAFQHLHRVMAGDHGDLHVAEAGFLEEAAGGLVAQIMEMMVGQLDLPADGEEGVAHGAADLYVE